MASPSKSIDTKKRPPLVSVIIPSHNRGHMLGETITSIYEQNYPSIELFVIDDGSEDFTERVVKGFESLPGRIVRYVRRPRTGEAAAVNYGWHVAAGDYVATIGSDDPQPSDWLSTCIDLMEAHPQVVVGYPDWKIIGESGEVLHRVDVPDYSRERLIGNLHCLPGPGSIIRRTLVGGDELRNNDFRLCSDFECWLRLSLVGKFMHIPHSVAHWREHAENLSKSNSIDWYREMSQMISGFFAREDLPDSVRRLRHRAEGSLFYQGARKTWRDDPVLSVWLVFRAFLKLAPVGRFPVGHLSAKFFKPPGMR